MMKPSINNNGTSRESLVQDRILVMDKLRETIEALAKLNPHGRDYLGQDQQYNWDRGLHIERMQMLDRFKEEILEEALAIQRED